MVAGWTRVLTKKGEVEIRDLAESKEPVSIWNGQVYTDVTITKSTDTRLTVIMEFDNGTMLFCSPSHIIKLSDGTRTRAAEVPPESAIAPWIMPDGSARVAILKGVTVGPSAYLYGIDEPLQHTAILGGLGIPVSKGSVD